MSILVDSKRDNPIWHPTTAIKLEPEPLKVTEGKGALLKVEDNGWVIDAISSWWVNTMGHSHPKIVEAITAQAQKLEHVIFAGYTHEPAERLSKKLVELLPDPLKKVFFTDNGSTAIESALKMSYQYWQNIGKNEKKNFLCFERGYHGETVGAMSVGSLKDFTITFADLLFNVHALKYPATYEGDPDVEENEKCCLQEIEEHLKANHTTIAAMVIEPLIQGAGGFRFTRPSFLQKLRTLTKTYEVHLIYDEVMTGFGRTGDWFAATKSQTSPDIICLSKGITGGFLPLAVTATTMDIFDAFYVDDMSKMFLHSHSYTANPIACAAACAAIDLMNENQHLFRDMEARHRKHLVAIEKYSCISKIRMMGTIAAFDINLENHGSYFNKTAFDLRRHFVKQGVLLRPLGNIMYILPPYIITDEELAKIYSVIEAYLESISLVKA